jgi:hypothetical protein
VTTYFDSTVQADKNLLRPENRSYSDLANLAAEAEQDCIEAYTFQKAQGFYTVQWISPLGWDYAGYGTPVGATVNRLYVGLRGYTVDASDPTVDPDLKNALKRAIAHVIDWRIGQRLREQAISTTGVQGVSRAYLEEARDVFPRGWDRSLRRFDIRTPVWGS